MLLKNKIAVVFGGAGSVGTAISLAFAREGAIVFLIGRTLDKLEILANEINHAGGKATAVVADAYDEKAVNNCLQDIVKQAGQVDIVFNAIGIANKQNISLTEMSTEEFVRPVELTMKTHFITCTAAGRAMMKNGSGVILTLTATPGGIGYPNVGGFGPACGALENYSRNLAVELGVHGIRVVNIRSGGSPDTKPFVEALEADPVTFKTVIGKMKEDTMLKALPLKAEIANIAVFLSSDMASKITGSTIDATVGTTTGLNYRTSAPGH